MFIGGLSKSLFLTGVNSISYFSGVKIIRTRKRLFGDFVAKTIFSDYYIEVGKIVPITLKICVDILNLMHRPVRSLNMIILGAREDYHQKIEKIYSEYSIITNKDVYGNIYHEVEIPLIKPKKTIRISIKHQVRTFPFKLDKNIGKYGYRKSDIEKFLLPQPFQKHTHSKIKEIASKLLGHTFMETIKKVAIWIHNNIEYEKTYRRYSVTDTLSRRKGSCLSISDLAVAILRSLGIPATIVKGLYTENPHAWVEAYIPRNNMFVPVPIDVLSGFVGMIGSLWFSHYLEKSTRDREVHFDQKNNRVAVKQDMRIIFEGD